VAESRAESPEAEPARVEPEETPPRTLSEEWDATLAFALERTSDQALVADLAFDGERDGVMLLKFIDPASNSARFIESNIGRVQALVERAVGRRIPVELTSPAAADTRAETVEIDPKFAENPVVAEALSLFNATIHSVHSLANGAGEGRSGDKDNGDPDDV